MKILVRVGFLLFLLFSIRLLNISAADTKKNQSNANVAYNEYFEPFCDNKKHLDKINLYRFPSTDSVNQDFNQNDIRTLYCYERADPNDLDELASLYSIFSNDDKKCMVTFPGCDEENNSYQKIVLNQALHEGKIFVAREESSKHIVSFLKLFVVNDNEQLLHILQDELCVLMEQDGIFIANNTTFSGSFIKDTDYKVSQPIDVPYSYSSRSTYVYYGGAWTHPDYRKQGINLRLEKCALKLIIQEILSSNFKKGSDDIFYIYGVVNANNETTGPLRAAFTLIEYLLKDLNLKSNSLKLSKFLFPACKPEFPCGPYQKPVFDSNNNGSGVLIRYEIPRARSGSATTSETLSVK